MLQNKTNNQQQQNNEEKRISRKKSIVLCKMSTTLVVYTVWLATHFSFVAIWVFYILTYPVFIPFLFVTGPRAYHGTVCLGHVIYIVGGFDGTEYFNSVRAFNPISKTWAEVAPMNAKRYTVQVFNLRYTRTILRYMN